MVVTSDYYWQSTDHYHNDDHDNYDNMNYYWQSPHHYHHDDHDDYADGHNDHNHDKRWWSLLIIIGKVTFIIDHTDDHDDTDNMNYHNDDHALFQKPQFIFTMAEEEEGRKFGWWWSPFRGAQV